MKAILTNISKRKRIKTLLKSTVYPLVLARRIILKKKYHWQRQVMDNLTDVLVSDPIIRVKEFDGIFEIAPRSDLFYRAVMHKSYEPILVNLCMKYLDKNKDVVDAGANIGFYTVMFAKNIDNGKRVLAVEPTSKAIKRLRSNLGLNGIKDKVVVFQGVVSDRQGETQIKTITDKEEYSTMGEMNLPSTEGIKWENESVKSETLDRLVDIETLNPGFVKIDCEGAEHSILKGSVKVLQKSRPILCVELHHSLLLSQRTTWRAVIDFIKSYEYNVLGIANQVLVGELQSPGTILCFPQEKEVQLHK